MNEFGNYIKNIRESKNMTLNQVALYAEISAAQLSRIETGKRGTPKPQTIEKIARALKVDYNELMSIAGYIETDSPVDNLSEEVNSNPKLNEKDERDIGKRMAKIRDDLIEGISGNDNSALSFLGEPMSEEAIESLLEALEHAERLATLANKKYIPKKYRKD
ncbi:helix-turn-helix domain-containing protein [Lysinibacillus sphaericus]|uniref:helix-turn-helix domain-containing protein n=1 Tax=Lysinibacillus sphaericus TaxID=1421 RepID=UPI001A9F5DC7|nr:helix-turn-helix transcriptional regulator [Lysinibacillus sphaericus]QTB25234.1 helix-turn-helix domain-containing protein [Lysinibacillus sphaericus]